MLQKIPREDGAKANRHKAPASFEIAIRVKRLRDPKISAMVMFSNANNPSTAKL